MPIVDPTKLRKREVQQLARLFDELEAGSRKLGGAEKQQKLEKLSSVYAKIDQHLTELLGLDEQDIHTVRDLVNLLRERRTSRAREAEPEVLGGEEAPRIRIPRKVSRRVLQAEPSTRLDRWT